MDKTNSNLEKVTISWYNKNEIDRFDRLVNFYSKFKRESKNKCYKTEIKALHEHKGELQINWRTKPNHNEISTAENLWNEEGEYFLSHYVDDKYVCGNTIESPFNQAD